GFITSELRRLEGYSLVETVSLEGGDSQNQPTRFRLHNQLGTLAKEKLSEFPPEQSGEYWERIVDYFITICVDNKFAVMTREWDNIQSAMNQALKQGHDDFFRGLESLTSPHLGSIGYLDIAGR